LSAARRIVTKSGNDFVDGFNENDNFCLFLFITIKQTVEYPTFFINGNEYALIHVKAWNVDKIVAGQVDTKSIYLHGQQEVNNDV
jgi:hypothetical protein